MSSPLSRAVHLVTALVRTVGPDTVILVVLNLTGPLGELVWHTHLRIPGVERDSRGVGRTSGPKTMLESIKAILPAGPLADGKFTGLFKVGVTEIWLPLTCSSSYWPWLFLT